MEVKRDALLAEYAKTKDPAICNELVSMHHKFIYWVMLKDFYRFKDRHEEELYSAGQTAIFDAITRYDSSKSKFPTFAKWYVWGYMKRFLKESARREKKEESLDSTIDDKARSENFEEKREGVPNGSSIDSVVVHERAKAMLTAREYAVLKFYYGLDGCEQYTLQKIGAMLEISRERTRQVRDGALKKVNESLDQYRRYGA